MSKEKIKKAICRLCGEPMPEGEEMFNYHGYSSDCPKEPLKEEPSSLTEEENEEFYEVLNNSNIVLRSYECEAIKHFITITKHNAVKEERQFILNVLDGVDFADKQTKNKGGGTKAIRLALKSRVI